MKGCVYCTRDGDKVTLCVVCVAAALRTYRAMKKAFAVRVVQ